MLKVTVKGVNETINKLNGLKEEIKGRALVSALNKTATQGRNYSVKKIRQTYLIESSDLKEKIVIEKATKNKLQAVIIGKRENKPMSITRFSARMTKKGVSVKVKRTGGRYLWRKAFITSVNGTDIAFRRTGDHVIPKRGRYAGRIKQRNTKLGMKGSPLLRESLLRITGPTVADIMNEQSIFNDILQFTDKKLVELFINELRYYTGKHFGR